MNNHEFIDDILNRQKQEIDSFFSQKANIKAMEDFTAGSNSNVLDNVRNDFHDLVAYLHSDDSSIYAMKQCHLNDYVQGICSVNKSAVIGTIQAIKDRREHSTESLVTNNSNYETNIIEAFVNDRLLKEELSLLNPSDETVTSLTLSMAGLNFDDNSFETTRIDKDLENKTSTTCQHISNVKFNQYYYEYMDNFKDSGLFMEFDIDDSTQEAYGSTGYNPR